MAKKKAKTAATSEHLLMFLLMLFASICLLLIGLLYEETYSQYYLWCGFGLAALSLLYYVRIKKPGKPLKK
jgi:hypothetical protein